MMSHCVHLLLILFLIYHLIHHAVLKRNFLEFSSDSLMSNRLLISEMLLVILDSPHVYKEAVLPQRKDCQLDLAKIAELRMKPELDVLSLRQTASLYT